MENEIVELKKRIEELERLLGMNSKNSSKPPSSDPPGMYVISPKRQRKKRGAKNRHQPHLRELLPPETVKHRIELNPEVCPCGGTVGHKGYGRAGICEQDADKVEKICISNTCPDCGSILEDKGIRARAVIDCQPVKINKVVYHLERKYCPRCRKVISARPSGVLAK